LLKQVIFMGFKLDLSQRVEIQVSGEEGYVIGRAEYVDSENSYQVRYKSATGQAIEAWWAESALGSLKD
jgi:uncharacterized protein (DUF2126 family)